MENNKQRRRRDLSRQKLPKTNDGAEMGERMTATKRLLGNERESNTLEEEKVSNQRPGSKRPVGNALFAHRTGNMYPPHTLLLWRKGQWVPV